MVAKASELLIESIAANEDLTLRVGAHYQEAATTFVVWAPDKECADLIVDNNRYPLVKDSLGYWTGVLEQVQPGTLYAYSLDDSEPLPDPASLSQPEGVHGRSQVIDTSFHWTDDIWHGLPMADMIIYELHVGTFSPEGTFEGVISRLPYLKQLGVNAIELMPVAQFPGDRNWGYDAVYPFAVQYSYGGAAALQRLVNEAHRLEIAVILDVVYNHQGPEGNYLPLFGPYFTDKYKTFWGQAINFDDAYCYGVRSFYWQNAVMWLKDFHIDGLRLDAVHAIWDFSARHFIDVLQAKVQGVEKETGRIKLLIAEFDLNNPRYINPKDAGGYGLSGQWIDEFHHALHALVTGETDGYYEDFGSITHLQKAFQDTYVYTGQFSKHRKKFFGQYVTNPYSQFVVFSQNHDQIGNRLLGDRLTSQLSFEALKVVAATYLLSPHVPMLFMGEEYGEKNPFQYFISHTDEELVSAVREGRLKEFSYFNWQGEIPDPQSRETFQQCKLSWDFSSQQSAVLLKYYKFLIQLRKELKALKSFDRRSVVVHPSDDLLVVERTHNDDKVLLVFNLSKQSMTYDHTDNLTIILNSAGSEWSGPCHDTTTKSDGRIDILPESVVILAK